jgi:hypothetical protein
MSGGVGRVNDSQGDFVRGVCWTGIAVNNESADARPFQTVRISPIVSWEASWGLGYVGVGLGGDPWAQVRGGFDVSAWGDAGTELASFRLRELFSVTTAAHQRLGTMCKVPMPAWYPTERSSFRYRLEKCVE